MKGLSDRHRLDLWEGSGIDPDLAESFGWRSAEAGEIGVIVGFNVSSPGIVIPYPNIPGYERVRLDHPHIFPGERVVDSTGKERVGKDRYAKYLSPKKSPNHAYILPSVAEALKDPSARIAITEGEKKALAAVQHSLPCIGLAGVWSWRGKSAPHLNGNKVESTDTLSELAGASWMGREVWLFWDSDALLNEQVLSAGRRFKEELRRRGARARLVVFQEELGGQKVGLDDWLHPKHGRTIDDLYAYGQTAVVSDAQRDFDIDLIEILKTSPRKIAVKLNWDDGALIEGLETADISVWARFRLAVFNQTSRFPKFKPVKGGSTWDDFIGDAVDMVGIEVEAPADASAEEILWTRIAAYLAKHNTEPKSLLDYGRPYLKGNAVFFKIDPLLSFLERKSHSPIDSRGVYDLLRKHNCEGNKSKRVASQVTKCWAIPLTEIVERVDGEPIDEEEEEEE